jgi:hypothetical protein
MHVPLREFASRDNPHTQLLLNKNVPNAHGFNEPGRIRMRRKSIARNYSDRDWRDSGEAVTAEVT